MTAIIKNNPVAVQMVIGTQWGDEGKGKVVDLLGKDVDVVARYQGGPNAGHTVKFDNTQFILHHIPSGILRPHTQCIIGNGLVINPESFMEEIDTLSEKGIEVLSRLFISQNAHLILDYHIAVEKAAESDQNSGSKIGTTGRGIGPAYADKINRIGIRMQDLLNTENLRNKLHENVLYKNTILEKVYGAEGISEKKILDLLIHFKERVGANIKDTRRMIYEAVQNGKKILLEGAQGTHLDIDFGTYPFVTSSNTSIGGVFTGLGIAPKQLDRIIGIVKAYTTRVGNGPFPTELTDALGEELRKVGAEYGATTGRPRRCGWFDAMVVKYAVQLNGIDVLAITKLDVLDSLEEIHLCTGYRYQGQDIDHFPADKNILNNLEPVYEVMPGWKQSISDIRKYEDLPQPTRNYLDRIQELAETPIGIVSVGPYREETIVL